MCMHNITYCHFLLLQQQRWRLLREVWKLSIQVSLCLRFLPREWKPRLSFNRTENEDHPISKWILDVCSVVCNCFLSNIFTRGTAKRVSGRKKMGSEELSENIWGLRVKALCPRRHQAQWADPGKQSEECNPFSFASNGRDIDTRHLVLLGLGTLNSANQRTGSTSRSISTNQIADLLGLCTFFIGLISFHIKS